MKSVRFVTFGCKANQYDSQVLREALLRRGLEEQDRIFSAFLTASQDLLAPLSKKQYADADRSLRSLLHAFEAHREG